jgi:hypothetical protein
MQYLRIINTPPTLSDSLTAQDSNAWDTSNNPSRGCGFTNGAYHAFASRTDIVECLAKGTSFSNNFVYQALITITKGDGAGIIFGSSASNSLIKYRFYVNTASYCDLFVPFGGQRLFNSSQAPIISNSSLVAAMIIYDTIYLFINQKYVGQAHTIINGGPLSGQIGLFASESKNTTDVVFSQLNVWQINNYSGPPSEG